MPSQRMIRVNELLKREIAELLERVDFDLTGCLVSVREVDVSPDLRHAKVHISVLGGNDELNKKILRFMRNERVHLQKKISKDIVLKYTPVLEFSCDKRIALGDKVLAILDELETEGNL
jgi:ribosome-binding factor A